jgi:FkbM family methyltransferase
MLQRLAVQLSGNRFMQTLLEKNVNAAQYLMGIGSGTGVEASGESSVLRLIKETYSNDYSIFDVGSNKGQYLRLLQTELTDRRFTVHCFEPSAAAFESLRANVRSAENIRLNNFALGKAMGAGCLYSDAPGTGLSSLTKRRLDHFGISFDTREPVKIQTLDHYCSENDIQRIHLLKLDVEGHELDVLKGGTATFEKQAVGVVAFEFGGCNIDTRSFFQDFYYFFSDLKMRIWRITPSGYLFPVAGYKEIYEQFRTTNFVATASNK